MPEGLIVQPNTHQIKRLLYRTVRLSESLRKAHKKHGTKANGSGSQAANVLASLTIRPSPLPTSTSGPLLLRSISTTFSICFAVAGTKGRQILRRAGVINGVATAYTATSVPPTIPVNKSPQPLFFKPLASRLVGSTDPDWRPSLRAPAGVPRLRASGKYIGSIKSETQGSIFLKFLVTNKLMLFKEE